MCFSHGNCSLWKESRIKCLWPFSRQRPSGSDSTEGPTNYLSLLKFGEFIEEEICTLSFDATVNTRGNSNNNMGFVLSVTEVLSFNIRITGRKASSLCTISTDNKER